MSTRPLSLPSELSETALTVAQLAESLYPGITYDYARPISWDTLVRERGIEPNGRFVWLYPKGSIFGFPAPLTREAALDLGRLSLSLK